jgi:rare lipoprotein A (peptidoglycan hydrolase)
MANGRIFHEKDMVAASNFYPLGTTLSVTNLRNGVTITIVVQDRTSEKYHGLDLSEAAFDALQIPRRDGWTLVKTKKR